MKKINLFGFGILFSILILSCSSEGESTSDSTSLILPKKTNFIENSDYDIIGQDTYITYNGNKIVSEITEDQWKNVFTYTGDFITKIESYDYGELYETIDYTYLNGKLASRFKRNIDGQSSTSYLTNYTHNPDGTVSYSSKYGKGILTFKNGNLINDGENTYEYDNKNNPFNNILGISVLSIDRDTETAIYNVSKNNCTKTKGNELTNHDITYNSNGYPTLDKEYYDGETTGYGSYKYYY
ncbi:MAG: hypothetical protein IPO23_11685 [Flavobacterium sp.]|nr:hypothetical protein [Flavobacterium sp.]